MLSGIDYPRKEDIMKKLISLLLAAMMILSLAACGSKGEAGSEPTVAKVIDVELTQEQYAFGVRKDDPQLLELVNLVVEDMLSSGKFEEICNNYFGDGTPEGIISAELGASDNQLIVATNAEFAPFEYKEGEAYYGIDMEVANYLAQELGKQLVIVNMDFDAVCLSVSQGKADIAMAGLTITEERKDLVDFSVPYYDAAQKLVVKADNTEFDACASAADVEAILNAKDSSCKIGVQNGTTGQFYVMGDEDWGFAGYATECVGYKNGSLAIQDMLNGNIDYVIIDSAPAAAITEAINAMR